MSNKSVLKKYEIYISNIEWHIRVNKPTKEKLEKLNKQLDIYREVIHDFSIEETKEPSIKEEPKDHIPDTGKMIGEDECLNEVRVNELHPDTKNLLKTCFEELRLKLIKNQEKYGWSNEWLTRDWEEECRQEMIEHLKKGDPRDIAIYTMFMIYRGWATAKEESKEVENHANEKILKELNWLWQIFDEAKEHGAANVILGRIKEYEKRLLGKKEHISEDELKETIQNALYATKHFLTYQCQELAEGIFQYIKDAGFTINKISSLKQQQ